MRIFVPGCIVVSLLFCVAPASAQTYSVPGHWWSSVAAACTPGDPAVQSDRYTVTAGSVGHRSGAVGLVTLYCPVHPGTQLVTIVNQDTQQFETFTFSSCEGNRYLFRMTFRDSDGTGPGASVAGQLLRVRKSDGAWMGPVPNASFPANSALETTVVSLISHFDQVLDFFNFYYYVRIDLDRPSTAKLATFYGVAIECR